jgi:hypothetical protein
MERKDVAAAAEFLVAQVLGDTVAMVERVYAPVMPKDLLEATRILP